MTIWSEFVLLAGNPYGFIDLGEQQVHNIAEPVHAYRVTLSKSVDEAAPTLRTRDALLLPNKPSIAVLPFAASLLSSDAARQGAADWPVLSIVGNAEAVQYVASTQIHWGMSDRRNCTDDNAISRNRWCSR